MFWCLKGISERLLQNINIYVTAHFGYQTSLDTFYVKDTSFHGM
jgi:hypothetical protein